MSTSFLTRDRARAPAGAPPPVAQLDLVLPPYRQCIPLSHPSVPSAPRGSVVLVEVPDAAAWSVDELARAARCLRGGSTHALVVRVHEGTAQSIHLLGSARAIGFDAAIGAGPELYDSLRTTLAEPADLADDWLRWVAARHPLPARATEVLREVIHAAPDTLSLSGLLARMDTPARTVSHLLQHAGLPRLERWYHGARFLAAELRLQRDPALAVGRVAESLGYTDLLSYSSMAYRLFGTTPVASRHLLGLPWRFHEWWSRSQR